MCQTHPGYYPRTRLWAGGCSIPAHASSGHTLQPTDDQGADELVNTDLTSNLPAARSGRTRSIRSEMRQALRTELRLLDRMKRAVCTNQAGAVKFLTTAFFKSRCAKFVALEVAGQQLKRKGKPHIEGAALLDMANDLQIDHETGEQVHLFPMVKSNGYDIRPMHSYGQKERARQIMVAKVLAITHNTDERQYAGKGGRDAACQEAHDRIEQGYKFAVEVDIKNFYPSIDRDHLKKILGVDGKLIEGIVLSMDADVRPKEDSPLYRSHSVPGPWSLFMDARRGLPQGASSSPIVAEIVVAEIMSSVPKGMLIINFADNFLVMGHTRREVEDALMTLSNAIKRSPAGYFEVKKKSVRRIVDGFDFLGYRFRSERGRPKVSAASKPLEKLCKKIAKEALRVARTNAAGGRLWSIINGWRSAFRLWKARCAAIFCILRDMTKQVGGLQPILNPMIRKLLNTSPNRALFAEQMSVTA